ncbi:PREDICTED: mitochondrial import receptor subunit TOM40 homolog 1 [Dinoponera quadriceps]|uniref:Mitochondrial import receptor subunit TOM40 homolog 1 n=1 Tax=Dinoponera quadriceps TaxID=609295 RepID=A0A6P3XNE8_DINQU|nr:PREDICTED: mitochondrial import receptor subunit TOM40 homolog 1 [Dinoponera quadriceps]
MGNVVQAASSTTLPPMPFMPPGYDAKRDAERQDPRSMLYESNNEVVSEAKIENPGTIEDLHKKCKDIFPMNFEGAKLVVNKGLSNHFHISHTINMGNVVPSCYRFGATYVGTKQVSPAEAYPVLLGDIDPSGNLNASILHQFGSRLKTKFAAQVQRNKYTAVQLTSDYRGDNFTFSATLGNPDIINNSGVMVLHYLHSVTPSLALGGELAYQRGAGIPGGQVALLSAAGRYTHGNSTISGSISPSACHLCFHQQASSQVQVGVELEINARIPESTATLAYQVDLPKADLVFRGSIDTNWIVGAVLEKRLQPLPFSFALSGVINHSKQQFRLGCGLIIG